VELATAAERIHWSKVDAVIVPSEAIGDRLRGIAGNNARGIAVVNYGVNLDAFRPWGGVFQYRLGMVCSLLPIKRVYEVLLCLYELRRSGHPFTLHIAGAPQERARRYGWALHSLPDRLGMSKQVNFHGYVHDVADWLQGIDVFISNSYWEGQQVALLEAMASGRYCLSHCWDGAEEVLPDENIFTTDSDLRAKLISYAGLPEAEKRQAQARMRAIAEERFDERRMVRDIVEVIQSLGAT
jgi:glycosyltransferase involved in cell wall biosynthesis